MAEPPAGVPLAMDRAYEGDETRKPVRDLGMTPVAPPKANRKEKRDLDLEPYKLRNEVERQFRRSEGFRRIYTRYDKLDAMFPALLNFACIVEMLSANTP